MQRAVGLSHFAQTYRGVGYYRLIAEWGGDLQLQLTSLGRAPGRQPSNEMHLFPDNEDVPKYSFYLPS
jgi:hypothetical protein